MKGLGEMINTEITNVFANVGAKIKKEDGFVKVNVELMSSTEFKALAETTEFLELDAEIKRSGTGLVIKITKQD